MIDLACPQPLQTCLVVDGAEVPVDTSFRSWLRFGRILDETGLCDPSVLLGEVPGGFDWRPAALDFLNERPSTPRPSGKPQARAYDLDEDAPYLVGSFQQAYGIDLTDPALSMHWHRFLALLRSLPQSTKLAEIAGYRTWSRADEKRSHESKMAELRTAWELPDKGNGARERAIIAQQMEWFGDVTGEVSTHG